MSKNYTVLSGIILLILGGVAVAAATSGNTVSHTPKSAVQTEVPKQANAVNIQNYKFAPSPLKVKKGTTVTWTNKDIAKHNVEVDNGQPAGGPNGPLIGKGQSYSFTFNAVGTYSYHCSPHPYMKGVVEVTE